MGPFAHADGCDLPWPFDRLVPRLAAERDEVVVGWKDAVREPVFAHELPDILDRVEFRRAGRQRQEGDDGSGRRVMLSGMVSFGDMCHPA